MTTLETVKAWKDEEYRGTLSVEQMERLPRHPSGLIELQQGELKGEASFAAPDVEVVPQTSHYDCTYVCCKRHHSL